MLHYIGLEGFSCRETSGFSVTVNYFEGDLIQVTYSFDATIKVSIFDDLYISFSDIAGLLNI